METKTLASTTYLCSADMGSLMIEGGGVRQFFPNGFGDGAFQVTIIDGNVPTVGAPKFVGHFEVLPGHHANMHDYDCGGNIVHVFGQGRYPVFSDGHKNLLIGRWN